MYCPVSFSWLLYWSALVDHTIDLNKEHSWISVLWWPCVHTIIKRIQVSACITPHNMIFTLHKRYNIEKKRNSGICVRNTLVISERHCKKIKYKVSTLLLFGHECISLKFLKWQHWRIKNECSFPVAIWKDPSLHFLLFISEWPPKTSLLKALKGLTCHPKLHPLIFTEEISLVLFL